MIRLRRRLTTFGLLAVAGLTSAMPTALAQTTPPKTGTAASAPAAQTVTYTLDPAKSRLAFTFLQGDALNTGVFRKFAVDFAHAKDNPAASRLSVKVDVASLNTGDEMRDATMRGADMFHAGRFPEARFTATQISATGPGSFEARGPLTIRDVTREVTVPFTFRTTRERTRAVAYMKGETVINRIDFNVGRGEWEAPEKRGNEVKVSFDLRLLPR